MRYRAHGAVFGSKFIGEFDADSVEEALPLAEAEAYLAWLDAGNVGRHFEQQRAAKPSRSRDDLQRMVDAACPTVLPGTCKLGCGRPIWVESRTVGGGELRMCEPHTRNVWSGAIDEDGITGPT